MPCSSCCALTRFAVTSRQCPAAFNDSNLEVPISETVQIAAHLLADLIGFSPGQAKAIEQHPSDAPAAQLAYPAAGSRKTESDALQRTPDIAYGDGTGFPHQGTTCTKAQLGHALHPNGKDRKDHAVTDWVNRKNGLPQYFILVDNGAGAFDVHFASLRMCSDQVGKLGQIIDKAQENAPSTSQPQSNAVESSPSQRDRSGSPKNKRKRRG